MINEKILAELRGELNAQTAQMHWKELERWYAGGTVITVSGRLDLVDAGARIAADDKESVVGWMQANLLHKVTDDEAAAWHAQDALLWVVVVKPWILVQHERQEPTAVPQ